MKPFALALRFLLELAALAALAYTGIAVVDGPLGWVVGVGALALAATVWGLFVSPKAKIVLGHPLRFVIELAVFAAASLGLVWAGRPVLAAVLAGLFILDRLALGLPLYDRP